MPGPGAAVHETVDCWFPPAVACTLVGTGAAVSTTHSSTPLVPLLAVKKTLSTTRVKLAGNELEEPGRMSLTM